MVSNRTIKPGRNYVHRGERKRYNGVYIDHIDSARLIPRETNVRLGSVQQHIDKDHLPDIAPAKQIKDALTAEEYTALGEYIKAAWLCYTKYKTTSFEEAVSTSRSEGGIPLHTEEFKILRIYWLQSKALISKHRDFLELFSQLVESDVGQVRKRRSEALQAFYELGKIIVSRDTKSVQIAGLAGYLKAVAEILVAKRREYELRPK